MEPFDTLSTHPVVQSVDTMSICMKKLCVEHHCLYKRAAVLSLSIFPCLLSDIKGNVCAIIVLKFTDSCRSFDGPAWALTITVKTN